MTDVRESDMDATTNPQTDTYICTWLYADSAEDESTFHQVPGRSSTERFQETYWRCVSLFFVTSVRQQPDARHLLFTNVTALPVVDGVRIDSLLDSMGVEIVRLPLNFRTPPGYYHAWRNQFYAFDIARYLSKRLRSDDAAVVLDSDCVWISSGRPMTDALRRDGSLTYVVTYPVDRETNGLTRAGMSDVAASILGRAVPDPLIYCGGELLAATGAQFVRIATEAEAVWQELMARHTRGEETFKEEGQTLSFIYYKLGFPLGNGDPFVRRIWTGSFGAHNNAVAGDHGLVVWHLPLEKRFGMRRLFPQVADRQSLLWTLPTDDELREFLGSTLGVERNPIPKRFLDGGRRVVDKIRYR
jgi:hypothetical protein